MRVFISLLVAVLAFQPTAFTQTRVDGLISNGSVSVGDKAAADSKAVLDVKSTTKGFLPPRMTGGQRDAIVSPTTGLVIFNTTTNKVNAFNGTSWTEVGGGAGGIYAGGQNLISNNSFETDTTGWTESAGTFQRETGAADIVPPGVGSASWDPSSSSQTLSYTSTTITANDGISGRNGAASCAIKTAATDLLLQAYDGTNVIVSQAATASSSGFVRTTLNFVFPSSGTVQLRFVSQSNSAIAYVDDCFLGLADAFNISQVSQASLYGTATILGAVNCVWQTSSTTYANFSADSDCNNGTATGNISAAGTKIPGFTMTNVPPGEYLVLYSGGGVDKTGAQATSAFFRLTDGTTVGSEVFRYNGTSTTDISPISLSLNLSYTTARSSVTVQIQGSSNHASNTASLYNNTGTNPGIGARFLVYRFPTASQLAYNSNLTDWFVVADITGGNPSLGISNVSAYTEITDSALTLTPVSGSAPAGIMCSSTNAATAPTTSATTCAAGSESVGANFNIPVAGWYEICVDASHQTITDTSEGINTTFQIIETPTNAQTLTQECGPRLLSGSNSTVIASGADMIVKTPGHYCGQCNFASVGTKGVRLMYEQAVAGTPDGSALLADADASNGQRAIRMTVRPMRYSVATPLLMNSVSNSSSGVTRIEAAEINCDGSSQVNGQLGSWVSSVGNISSGACTVTLNSGSFASAPYCTSNGSVQDSMIAVSVSSSTSLSLRCSTDAGGDCASFNAYLMCVGPR